jgi:isochorismate pyruvate lyase
MNSERIKPAACTNMVEVRAGIDSIDRQLVGLFGERFRYMDAAARIKNDRVAVRDEQRKAEVLANVRKLADEERIPGDKIVMIYELLIESSIAYEFDRFDEMR